MAYFFFLQLNVKTFMTLLQLLRPEVEGFTPEVSLIEGETNSPKLSDRITPLIRRVLPGIRIYSMWIVSNWALLAAEVADAALNVQIRDLWRVYADTLTQLASNFPAKDLPEATYMLEEDVNTIGFEPLISEKTKRLWGLNDSPKPKFL